MRLNCRMPASPIVVLSSLALKGVLEKHRASFEKSLGAPLDLRFDATQAILAKLDQGASGDLLVLTSEAMDALGKKGRIAKSRVLGSSGVGVAVSAGARKPDISSVDAFLHAVTSAGSVAHSKVGASGIYFSRLLKDLKIEDKLRKRVVVEKGPVGLVVARGEAELGIQQLCELAPVPGIDIVGGLPAPLQVLTWFAAGIPKDAVNAQGAEALLEVLQSGAARAAMIESRIDPAG